MARIPRKGDCGGIPRVGKPGDPKPARGGRRRLNRGRRRGPGNGGGPQMRSRWL